MRLSEVYYSLDLVDESGETTETIVESVELGKFYYPAGHVIGFSIGAPASKGVYRLTILGRGHREGTALGSYYFLHNPS